MEQRGLSGALTEAAPHTECPPVPGRQTTPPGPQSQLGSLCLGFPTATGQGFGPPGPKGPAALWLWDSEP